jgi:Effector-associated domain 1
MRDPRLSDDGLTRLIDVLMTALADAEDVVSVVERAGMTPGMVIKSRTVDHQWQDAILGADARDRLDQLLAAIEHDLKGYKAFADFGAWVASARHRQKPADAAVELTHRLREIRAYSDPRDALVLARSLRSALLDVQEGFEGPEGRALLLAVDDRSAAAARTRVLAACRDALTAADTLLTAGELAAGTLSSRRASEGAEVRFRQEHEIVRVLIDDRDAAADRLRALLDVLRSEAPGVFASDASNRADPTPK